MMPTNAFIEYPRGFQRNYNLVANALRCREVVHCDHWSRFQSSIMGFLVNFLVNCHMWATQVSDLWLISLCSVWTSYGSANCYQLARDKEIRRLSPNVKELHHLNRLFSSVYLIFLVARLLDGGSNKLVYSLVPAPYLIVGLYRAQYSITRVWSANHGGR